MNEVVLNKLIKKTEEVCEYERLCTNMVMYLATFAEAKYLPATYTKMSNELSLVAVRFADKYKDAISEVERLKALLDENKIDYKKEGEAK